MEDLSKYYKEGATAFTAGKPVTRNPYPLTVWNAYHGMWRRGWSDAHSQAKNPKPASVKIVDKSFITF